VVRAGSGKEAALPPPPPLRTVLAALRSSAQGMLSPHTLKPLLTPFGRMHRNRTTQSAATLRYSLDATLPSPLPWPSLHMTNSAPFVPLAGLTFRRCGEKLRFVIHFYVTGCCFVPSSRRVTTLRHSQSPGCTGCLLSGAKDRGCLSVTRVGLTPTSRR
jgi:hypothetical protein